MYFFSQFYDNHGFAMSIYGYACASMSTDLAAQEKALFAAGAGEVFSEGDVGTVPDRDARQKAVDALRRDDVLMVTHLANLACSSRDLLTVLDDIVKVEAGIKSLSEPWIDTTMPHRYLLAQMIAGLAEFERGLNRSKSAEGINRAKRAGIHIGRPLRLTDSERLDVLRLREAGASLRDIAAIYGCSYMTISRLVHPR